MPTRSAPRPSRSSPTTRPPGAGEPSRPMSCRVPRAPGRPRHRPRGHPRLVPDQPRRPGARLLRAVDRPRSRASSRPPRRSARASSTSTSGRIGDTSVADGDRAAWPTRVARVLDDVDDDARRRAAGPGELGRRRVRHRHELDELAGHRRGGRRARRRRPRGSGFCLDTAHAWGAGIDLSRPAAVDAFVDAFDRRIGLERLVMVHLNDSKSELGSRIGSPRAPRGRAHRRGRACARPHPPGLARATYLPRDPGHGRGLRRGQYRARLRPHRRPSAGRPAARGVRRCAAAGRGPARPSLQPSGTGS